ncbi:hypothetical protein KY284_028207 [Solanum tuberosum]|nr:hypothetical protein KY284_028207 [Solanum tuberosum]
MTLLEILLIPTLYCEERTHKKSFSSWLVINYDVSRSFPGMEENRDNMSVQEATSDRNSRRRARYAQMSPERKELLLSQLRQKRAESKRQKLLHQSNSTGALTISTSSLSPQQVEASEPTHLPVTSTTTERIVNCLSTFEVGSTSTTSHVASKFSSRRTANTGQCGYDLNKVFKSCRVRSYEWIVGVLW